MFRTDANDFWHEMISQDIFFADSYLEIGWSLSLVNCSFLDG